MWIAERGQELDLSQLVDPNRTALVVIDVQNDFCHPEGAFGRVGHDNSRMPDLAAALHRLLAEARARKVMTVFVRATYDREVTSRPLAQHRRRLGLLQSLCLEGSWGADWFAGVAPAGVPSEVVLTKHRFDAFQGTPLDLYLRSNGIRNVIVTGVVTSGCVESTVRDAFFLDYQVVVPHDGVDEANRAFHDTALGVMRRSFATISSVDEIIAAWRQSNAPVEPSWQAEERRRRADTDEAAEGLVLVDAAALDPAARAAAEMLAAAARARGIPLFDVCSIAIDLGRTPWLDADHGQEGGTELRTPASPGCMPVGKMRRSAFADTRLKLLLRANDVRHLTVAGADRMPGSLLATVLDGLDADFAVSVVGEACGDADVAMLQRAGARLTTAAAVAARWQGGAPVDPPAQPAIVAQ